MTAEEMRKHNEAILSKLDLKQTLAEYQSDERVKGRGNVFINLVCLLLYLRKKEGREFSRSWILEQIGVPDRTEDAGSTMDLHYRLKFSECPCTHEHWATISLKEDRLDGFGTYSHPTKA